MTTLIRLISKKIEMDDNFSPVLRFTIELPFDPIQDAYALLGENEVIKMLGTNLYELLKNERN
jgi:hypothetical protein